MSELAQAIDRWIDLFKSEQNRAIANECSLGAWIAEVEKLQKRVAALEDRLPKDERETCMYCHGSGFVCQSCRTAGADQP